MAADAPAVLIPAAPRDDVLDTVASVKHYLPGSPVVVLDDGLSPQRAADLARVAVVLPSLPYPRNAYGGLWLKFSFGFKYILRNLSCPFVLRLDADALIVGPGLSVAVKAMFEKDTRIGLVGGFRRGPDDKWRDFSPMRRAMAAEVVGLRSRRHWSVRKTLRPLVREAEANGYELGDHAIACVLAVRTEMLQTWLRLGLLDLPSLRASSIGDDGFFGLFTAVSGYQIAEMGGANDPIKVNWRGLPASPDRLLAQGALAVHSVRSWGGADESEIRRFFAGQRESPSV